MATPPKRSLRGNKPWEQSLSTMGKASTDICQICGKAIRGKAERFLDVHGNVYHLGCYQEKAGEVPEDACRICQRGFESTKDRVKDVVGFFYHRKCYEEELERQRLAASGVEPDRKAKSASEAPIKSKAEPERELEEDDWNLTPDSEDDWEFDGEVDDGWMRPDPEELELKADGDSSPPIEPTIKLPGKPVERPPLNPLARKSELRPRQPDASGSERPDLAAKDARSSQDVPRKPAPRSKKVVPESKRPGTSESPGVTAKKKSTTAKARQRPKAKPIEAAAAAPAEAMPALPEGLELLPDEPQSEVVDGLEVLDSPSMVPAASAVPLPSSPGDLVPFDGLEALEGLEPLGDSPFMASANVSPGGVSVDPLTGEPMVVGPRRRRFDSSIPTWLWGVMGVGVGVVVIMLTASVVSVMWTSQKNREPIASSASSEGGEVLPWEEESGTSEYEVGSGDDASAASVPSEPPASSRLAKIRELREEMGGGFVFWIGVWFAIYLGVSTLALKLTCMMFGESGATSPKIVGICLSQLGASILFSLITSTLDSTTALFIDAPIGIAMSSMLIRFILPTDTGRAIGIAIIHVIMSFVVAVVLVVGIVALLLMWIMALRPKAENRVNLIDVHEARPAITQVEQGYSGGSLEKVSGFDFKVAVDEGGGHVFGEGVEHHGAFADHVGEDLVAPGEDIGRGGGTPEFVANG